MKTPLSALCLFIASSVTSQIYGPSITPSVGLNVGIGAGPYAPAKLYTLANHGSNNTWNTALYGEATSNSAPASLTGLYGRVYTSGGTCTSAYSGYFDMVTPGGAITNAYALYASLPLSLSSTRSTGLCAAISAGSVQARGLDAQVNGGATTKHGLYSYVGGTGNTHYGIYTEAFNAVTNYGIRSEATFLSNGATCYGVYGKVGDPGGASNGKYGYAIFGKATVYAPGGGVSLTGSNTNSFAGWFDGHVWVNNLFAASDARLKRNIHPVTAAVALLSKVACVTYEFDHSLHPDFNLPYGKQYGLLAQNIEMLIPELVTNTHVPASTDKDGKVLSEGFDVKGVNYLGVVPILVSAVQEQDAAMASKDQEIKALRSRVENLEKAVEGLLNGRAILSGVSRHSLSILPNPTSTTCYVSYNLPGESRTAFLDVYAANGRLARRIPLTQLEQGRAEINVGDMPDGAYNCVLMVDGNQFDSATLVVAH